VLDLVFGRFGGFFTERVKGLMAEQAKGVEEKDSSTRS
jgi:hypothetical protein